MEVAALAGSRLRAGSLTRAWRAAFGIQPKQAVLAFGKCESHRMVRAGLGVVPNDRKDTSWQQSN